MSTDPRVCIVTGANAGIGKAAVLQLAQRGATVVMACRNAQRGEAARAEIAAEVDGAVLHLMSLDTSSLASVRSFAAAAAERFPDVHALINNAGNFDLMQKSPVTTEDGLETIFATNYFGPWLLTQLLLEPLGAGGHGRVLNVGSKGLMAYPFLGVELDNLDGSRKFNAARAYYHSKLALLMYTVDLAKKLEDRGVVANAVRVPAVQVALDRLPSLPALQLSVYKLKRRYSLTPAQMAKTYTALALDDAWAAPTGCYVDEKCGVVGVPKSAQDADLAAKLWATTASLAGVEA